MISTTKRTVMSWMLVATVFATTAAACGSDDDKKPATTAAESGTDATDAPSSGNADVDAFCTKTEELAAEYKKFMADPTSGDGAALAAKAQELTTASQGLISANSADASKISACLQAMSTAMTGG